MYDVLCCVKQTMYELTSLCRPYGLHLRADCAVAVRKCTRYRLCVAFAVILCRKQPLPVLLVLYATLFQLVVECLCAPAVLFGYLRGGESTL